MEENTYMIEGRTAYKSKSISLTMWSSFETALIDIMRLLTDKTNRYVYWDKK